ncbi:hypothetical protein [Actinomadura sp. 6K520]|uniref:hypothetical protein n=1 Tax=Actinomadura sp. 6K520 TaxID=2530364 RepID=UPI001048BDC2|nr:hypothetical protein [Actinomadura sp. 6K520]
MAGGGVEDGASEGREVEGCGLAGVPERGVTWTTGLLCWPVPVRSPIVGVVEGAGARPGMCPFIVA